MVELNYEVNRDERRAGRWLVALYETEERAHELLERLHARGLETAAASIVRVEVTDQQRTLGVFRTATPPPDFSNTASGAIIGACTGMPLGVLCYEFGWLNLQALAGLPAHALVCLLLGAGLGTVIGVFLDLKRQRTPLPAALSITQLPTNDGYLIAVKLTEECGRQAERIARELGAKEILP